MLNKLKISLIKGVIDKGSSLNNMNSGFKRGSLIEMGPYESGSYTEWVLDKRGSLIERNS